MIHEYFHVPENFVGLILGKKRSRLNSIEIKYNVKILNMNNQFSVYSKESNNNCIDAKNHIISIFTKKILKENECPVCLDKIDIEKNYTITDCGHRFHTNCLLKSLENNNKCPICREKLREDKKIDVETIVNNTIGQMRTSNYIMSNLLYFLNYSQDMFTFQLIMEELIKQPLTYALNEIVN